MKLKQFCILLNFILWAFPTMIYGQQSFLSGKVVDQNGDGLSGVTVASEDKSATAMTNESGEFKIPGEVGWVLVFSHTSYLSASHRITQSTGTVLTLTSRTTEMDEFIVIGYGKVKKSDLTGSITQVRAEDIKAVPSANILYGLSGRAAGVQVVQANGAPGGSVSVRIRGTNSIQGSSDPLYVVDGFPVIGNFPGMINNTDIESVEILKDASATAIYGSRGANGVVLITTRKGKSGKTRVSLESTFGVQRLRKKLDLMSAQEFARFYNLQAANDGLAPRFTEEQIQELGNGFDWQDASFESAPIQSHNLSVTGGNDKTTFALSGSVFNQKGIIRNSGFERYTFSTNLTHRINDHFTVDGKATLSQAGNDRKTSEQGNRGGTMMSAIVSSYPTLTPYNDDGTYRNLSIAYPWGSNAMNNPIMFIDDQFDRINAKRVLANAGISYKPISSLTFRINGGVESSDTRQDIYTTRNFIASIGRASVNTVQNLSKLGEFTASFQDSWAGRHSINAVAGATYQDFLTTSLSGSGQGFLSDLTETSSLSSAQNPGIPNSGYTNSVLLSYLGRVNYSFDNRYLFTASFRMDGSSRYSAGNKWGYFPSGAFAWKLSEEEFIKNVSYISDLKLRIGYGVTGNQSIAPYSTLNQLTPGRLILGNSLLNTFAPGTRLPGNLRWESTAQTNVGIDASFFNSRLSITADYYIKNTYNLLNTVNLPSSLGFTTTLQNVGSIRNQGLDLSVQSRILTGNFKWDVNANVSINRNKVVKLSGGDDIRGGYFNISFIQDYGNLLRENYPIGMFYGFVEDGYDDKGHIKFRDLNQDGAITIDDKTFIGNPNPKYTYGFQSFMEYKGVSFTAFFQGSQGNDIFNISAIGNTLDYNYGLNMPREVLNNHWTPENPNAKYPVISRISTARISDRMIEDGSYLRLKNIELAYSFPADSFLKGKVSGLRLFVSAQNLLTFTSYSWWDPEVNTLGAETTTAIGFDFNSYPTNRSFTFGLNATF